MKEVYEFLSRAFLIIGALCLFGGAISFGINIYDIIAYGPAWSRPADAPHRYRKEAEERRLKNANKDTFKDVIVTIDAASNIYDTVTSDDSLYNKYQGVKRTAEDVQNDRYQVQDEDLRFVNEVYHDIRR